MKITKSIVDNNLKLIGFFIEGTSKEFGEFGTNRIEKAIPMSEMIKANFKNKQLEVTPTGIKEVNGFKINTLPMTMYSTSTGNFEVIPNTINITKRVLVNGVLKGFDVSWQGSNTTKRYTYDNVVRLASWFNPGNFVIRHGDDGKVFIAGKPGVMRISDLPEDEIGNETNTGKKKRNSMGKVADVKGSDIKINGNLLELYDMIRSCDGLVINLPDEKYVANTVAKEKVATGFSPLGVGEIGSPYINFGDKKLNANTNFKNVGTVAINFNNMPMPIYTFTWSTKSIFVNGKNHINRFGIGVTADVAKSIIQKFGEKLIVKQITDKKVTEPIVSLTGKKDFVFFEVDTSTMEIMSEETAKGAVINDKALYDNVKRMIELKAEIKVIKECLKELGDYPKESKTKTNKPLFGLFAGMKDDMLKAITEAGVDVFTGAYVKKEKVDVVDKDKVERAEKSEDGSVEVEYDIVGCSLTKFKKATVEAIIRGEEEAPKYCTASLIGAIKKYNSYKTPKSKLAFCEGIKEEAEKELNSIRMTLWMHKVAMFKLGNGDLLLPNKEHWKAKASRAKNSEVYVCTADGANGLCMKVTNISIK